MTGMSLEITEELIARQWPGRFPQKLTPGCGRLLYFHHGFFGPPSMYRTAAMNVSKRHGSWRWPVMRQRSSYIAYGSRPDNSPGIVIPNWRRPPATAGPTLGMSSRRAVSFRLLDRRVVVALRFIVTPHTIDRTTPPSTRRAAPLVAEAVVSLCQASFNLSFSERMARKLAHCNESLKEQPVLPEQVAVRFPELLQRLP